MNTRGMSSKETWDSSAQDFAALPLCPRAEDLIACLYGEASESMARDFESHAEHCGTCRLELAEFGRIRESIGEWRREALGSWASPVAINRGHEFLEAGKMVRELKHSALVAIREFFTLSPLWLKAGAVMASVIFCVLAVTVFAHLFAGPELIVIERPVADVNALARKDAQIAAALAEQQSRVGAPTPVIARVAPEPGGTAYIPVRHRVLRAAPSTTLARVRDIRRAPSPIAQPEQRLAEYMPFTATEHEERLPRLTDLLEEESN